MHVSLFNLQFPSVQTFNINCFLHAPFQDLPNLMTRERKVDKGKVCGEPVFICTQTTWSMNMTPYFLFGRSHTGTSYHVDVLPGTQRHWNLSLRQNWAHLCRRVHASCLSPVCSGGSWPSPSLVGMLLNLGGNVQGERTAHRCVELHRDLGRKGGPGKASVLWFQFGFYFRDLNESKSHTILFTASSRVSNFFHRIWCGPESYSRPARHIQSSWGVSRHELSVWDKLEQL